jgi:hypothetical protein
MRFALDAGRESPVRTAHRSTSHALGDLHGIGSPNERPLLHGIQARCACGGMCPRCRAKSHLSAAAPDDHSEKEADAVAEQVTRTAEPVPSSRAFAQSTTGLPAAAGGVGSVLPSAGQPLAPESRAFFESRIGYDFSGVRVHTGATAEQSARELGALAYTLGQDVVFGAGQFAPGTDEGRRLLAHELTHVIQQQGVPLENDTHHQQLNASITRIERKRIQKADDKAAASAPSIDWSEREIGTAGSAQPLAVVRERALAALRTTEAALRAAIESRNTSSGVPQALSETFAAAFPGESEAFLDLLLRRIELVQRIVPDVRVYHARQPVTTVDVGITGATLHNSFLQHLPNCPAAAVPQDKYIVTFPAWDRSEKYQPAILIHECFHYYFAEMTGHSTEKPTINPTAYASFIADVAGLDSGGSGLSCAPDIPPPPVPLRDLVSPDMLSPPDTAQPGDTGDQGGEVIAQ